MEGSDDANCFLRRACRGQRDPGDYCREHGRPDRPRELRSDQRGVRLCGAPAMTRAQAKAVLAHVANAVLETVGETPDGAPAGPMYLAFMQHGMSLETFEAITAALVDAKKIRREGDLFFPA